VARGRYHRRLPARVRSDPGLRQRPRLSARIRYFVHRLRMVTGHARSSSCRLDTLRSASHAHLAASAARDYVQAHAHRPPQ
jgi:hypothetical protein